MKQTIFLLRTAPYDYLLKGMDLYDSFDAVAQRKADPVLNKDAFDYFEKHVPEEIKEIHVAYCSPERRSRETAHFISQTPIITPSLNEVFYNMSEVIGKKSFFIDDKPNVQQARKAFVHGLITNKLSEKFDGVMQRVKNIVELINKQPANAVFFTHGFFLKLIEAYIRDMTVEYYPKNILKYFDGSVETFHFCEGFSLIKKNNNAFIFDAYICNRKVYL